MKFVGAQQGEKRGRQARKGREEREDGWGSLDHAIAAWGQMMMMMMMMV